MAKRSSGTFERNPRDWYRTPVDAVRPLIPHLPPSAAFTEPCAGDGALIDAVESLSSLCCVAAYDIEPQRWDIEKADALVMTYQKGLYIANPPWRRDILHPLILKATEADAVFWALFDADWLHTKQSIPFLPRLRKVVSVGRVKWIADSKSTGKDNCAWFCFTKPSEEPTLFYGRT